MIKRYIMTKLFGVVDSGISPYLITGEFGAKAYTYLVHELTRLPVDGILLLDFVGIFIMDSSFMDKSILQLFKGLVAGQFGRRYIALTNIDENTEFNIDLTIQGHRLKLAVPVISQEGVTRILGHLEANLRETLDTLLRKNSLTARGLMQFDANLAINTASTRLKKLFNLHLVKRKEEISESGRQHIYYPLVT